MNQAILSKPTYVADDQAKTWEYETNSAIEVDRNRWFLAALVMAGVGITSMVAVFTMLPMTEIVPAVAFVDTKLGLVTKVEQGRGKMVLTEQEVVQAADVRKYILLRETYDPQDVNKRREMIAAMSNNETWTDYQKLHEQLNEASPEAKYGERIRTEIDVKTVVQIDKFTYQGRFMETEVNRVDGRRSPPVAKVATVSFRYSDKEMKLEDRLMNPLNFRSTAYRVDRETR